MRQHVCSHQMEAPIYGTAPAVRVVQQQRHDVESVASAGAIPAASTNFLELMPQKTGTGLLIRYGEVATTSGSTILLRDGVTSNSDRKSTRLNSSHLGI